MASDNTTSIINIGFLTYIHMPFLFVCFVSLQIFMRRQKQIHWKCWEELAMNIKHQIRQSGFEGGNGSK